MEISNKAIGWIIVAVVLLTLIIWGGVSVNNWSSDSFGETATSGPTQVDGVSGGPKNRKKIDAQGTQPVDAVGRSTSAYKNINLNEDDSDMDALANYEQTGDTSEWSEQLYAMDSNTQQEIAHNSLNDVSSEFETTYAQPFKDSKNWGRQRFEQIA